MGQPTGKAVVEVGRQRQEADKGASTRHAASLIELQQAATTERSVSMHTDVPNVVVGSMGGKTVHC